jgi:hypothetical protein
VAVSPFCFLLIDRLIALMVVLLQRPYKESLRFPVAKSGCRGIKDAIMGREDKFNPGQRGQSGDGFSLTPGIHIEQIVEWGNLSLFYPQGIPCKQIGIIHQKTH